MGKRKRVEDVAVGLTWIDALSGAPIDSSVTVGGQVQAKVSAASVEGLGNKPITINLEDLYPIVCELDAYDCQTLASTVIDILGELESRDWEDDVFENDLVTYYFGTAAGRLIADAAAPAAEPRNPWGLDDDELILENLGWILAELDNRGIDLNNCPQFTDGDWASAQGPNNEHIGEHGVHVVTPNPTEQLAAATSAANRAFIGETEDIVARNFRGDVVVNQVAKKETPRLIGLCGAAGSGKDTAASFLVAAGWTRIAFADALKQVLYDMDPQVLDEKMRHTDLQDIIDNEGWDWTKTNCPTVRGLLQRLGVAVRDHVSPNAWVEAAMRKAPAGARIVITDVRFPNEIATVREMGGLLVEILRPGQTNIAGNHISETAWRDAGFDYTISNTGAIELLGSMILDVAGSRR